MNLSGKTKPQLERILRRLRQRVFDCPVIEQRGLIHEVKRALADGWRDHGKKRADGSDYHWMYACE